MDDKNKLLLIKINVLEINRVSMDFDDVEILRRDSLKDEEHCCLR